MSESQFIDRKVAKEKKNLAGKILRKSNSPNRKVRENDLALRMQKMDPDIKLTKVPICMRAAMRFAISKHLEQGYDKDSDVSSVKSIDYKINAKLEFSEKVPYVTNRFRDQVKKEENDIDDTKETKKTVYLEPWQRAPKLIAEPSRLFFRNVDDTKLFT